MVVMSIAALLVLLWPMFPYNSGPYQVGPGTYDSWTAQVSPSYYIVGCGVLTKVVLTTHVVGNGSWTYSKPLYAEISACWLHPTQLPEVQVP